MEVNTLIELGMQEFRDMNDTYYERGSSVCSRKIVEYAQSQCNFYKTTFTLRDISYMYYDIARYHDMLLPSNKGIISSNVDFREIFSREYILVTEIPKILSYFLRAVSRKDLDPDSEHPDERPYRPTFEENNFKDFHFVNWKLPSDYVKLPDTTRFLFSSDIVRLLRFHYKEASHEDYFEIHKVQSYIVNYMIKKNLLHSTLPRFCIVDNDLLGRVLGVTVFHSSQLRTLITKKIVNKALVRTSSVKHPKTMTKFEIFAMWNAIPIITEWENKVVEATNSMSNLSFKPFSPSKSKCNKMPLG